MKKKSLSAKKITRKNLYLNNILKDKKIFEIYKDFEKNLENLYIPNNKVAIAVSGGIDSVALCFLITCYKLKKNNHIKLFFYLVDHKLRKDSTKEAHLVKKQLKTKKINLKILKWFGKKPKSNIQNLARKKRYGLLFHECKKHNINTILTAHHKDDIYETFFSRLLRGSGTEGLSSFTSVEKKFNFKNFEINVVRPLLTFSKKELTYVTQNSFEFNIHDLSNDMDKFQRVRIRNMISDLKIQGLNFDKLNITLRNLKSSNKAINEIVHQNISKNVFFNKNKFLIKSDFFILPEEIIFRSFSILIKKISKSEYPPRGRKIINLIHNLKFKNKFKATLGGTIIEKIHDSVVVTKEKTKKS